MVVTWHRGTRLVLMPAESFTSSTYATYAWSTTKKHLKKPQESPRLSNPSHVTMLPSLVIIQLSFTMAFSTQPSSELRGEPPATHPRMPWHLFSSQRRVGLVDWCLWRNSWRVAPLRSMQWHSRTHLLVGTRFWCLGKVILIAVY